ncbi:MAG: ATP-grasp domain-containing protein [Gammaproteobacteria bacterium]|nr:ATP-grasp domain-containing protein [Gammaproteobacteria bacterium]
MKKLLPWRVHLSAEPREVLIFARAGRQLAAAALAAGYRALVADVFGDVDTRALATHWAALPAGRGLRLDAAGVAEVSRQFSARAPHAALVWGSGFERREALLQRLAGQHEVLGTSGAALRTLWEPARLSQRLRELDIPTPALRFSRVPRRGRWLAKQIGSAGGAHVRWARPGAALGRTAFAQAHCAGRSLSVSLVAGVGEVAVLGFCEHLFWPGAARPFEYGGALVVRDLPPAVTQRITSALVRLCPALGLVGLCGVDFVLDAQQRWWLIEINPRPTATFDLLAHAGDVFRAHLAASRGQPLPAIRTVGALRAQAVYYAPAAISVPNSLNWPAWTADRPQGGSTWPCGAPVCTVRASARTPAATRRKLQQRLHALAGLLGVPVRDPPSPHA